VYPGLRGVDEAALALIAERYGLDADPEDASPEPFVQPTLFITGRQDQIVGYRDAWARLEHYPRATFAVLDIAGHNAHMDQPGLTAALMTDWLHRVRAG
jgi:pimeloyl-ACP methyl ester carboxylesterase